MGSVARQANTPRSRRCRPARRRGWRWGSWRPRERVRRKPCSGQRVDRRACGAGAQVAERFQADAAGGHGARRPVAESKTGSSGRAVGKPGCFDSPERLSVSVQGLRSSVLIPESRRNRFSKDVSVRQCCYPSGSRKGGTDRLPAVSISLSSDHDSHGTLSPDARCLEAGRRNSRKLFV